MLARLEDAFERQKRFIADASHEMRTPLTILKGDVEVALNRPRSAGEYRETLEMVNETTDRLTALVEELFLLARADNRQFPLQVKRLNLTELLRRDVSHLLPQALEKKITLTLNAPDELPIEADSAKLSRLFMNLIDNALKYSTSGDLVTVTAGIVNDQARIAIADTGPGIGFEHLSHLFERFYRVDKARSRQAAESDGSSGAGLGLSIAAWLAKIHNGRIDVESQVGQGTTFIVWLPLSGPGQFMKELS
jgi:signal transduction histidine kinase